MNKPQPFFQLLSNLLFAELDGHNKFARNKLEYQEILTLLPHLLQVSLVLPGGCKHSDDSAGTSRAGVATSLRSTRGPYRRWRWRHVNPYGTFTLNMQSVCRLSRRRNALALLCRNLGLRYLRAQLGKRRGTP